MTHHAVVIGSAGFTGNHLAERPLENNHNVIVLDNLSGSLAEWKLKSYQGET